LASRSIFGQSRRGVDMGPSAVRVAGLEARLEALGHQVEDGGNVAVAIPEQKKEGDTHAKYLKEITVTCTKHAELVVKTLEAGKDSALAGRRSLDGRRHGVGCG
jgi:arginase